MSEKTKTNNLTHLSVRETMGVLSSGNISSVEIVEACIEKITLDDENINAFTYLAREFALQSAKESDSRRRKGELLSGLDGIPIAFKDNIDVQGQPTTNGLGTNWMPQTDAAIVQDFRSKGMILIGKTNMHEAALGATTDNPHHGKTFNPRIKGATPGGSSGGSGAAVSACFCPVAIGTDTMGSVRVPAAYCGVVGFKPSRNHFSTKGVMPLSTTLDTVGPITRTVEDVALVSNLRTTELDVKALKIATLENFDVAPLQEAVASTFSATKGLLNHLGVELKKCRLPDYDPSPARRIGLVVCEVELFSIMQEKLSSEPYAFSTELKKFLDYGATISESQYLKTLQKIDNIKTQTLKLFDEYDVIISPTTPQSAFLFANQVPVDQADFTALANFAGCPAISIPMQMADGLPPVGLQLMTAPGRDEKALSIAAVLETVINKN